MLVLKFFAARMKKAEKLGAIEGESDSRQKAAQVKNMVC
jgi:hypothetical protein